MDGVSIRYTYSGDEAAWRSAVDTFIDAVNADPDIGDKFSYSVSVAGDGVTRAHVGRWESEETLKTLQSRDYFKSFSKAIQAFAGDSLNAKQVTLYRETG